MVICIAHRWSIVQGAGKVSDLNWTLLFGQFYSLRCPMIVQPLANVVFWCCILWRCIRCQCILCLLWQCILWNSLPFWRSGQSAYCWKALASEPTKRKAPLGRAPQLVSVHSTGCCCGAYLEPVGSNCLNWPNSSENLSGYSFGLQARVRPEWGQSEARVRGHSKGVHAITWAGPLAIVVLSEREWNCEEYYEEYCEEYCGKSSGISWRVLPGILWRRSLGILQYPLEHLKENG